jgi:DNA-binding HxlR family transcriptional regulator
MAGRSYSQFCGVAHALDLVGERWALLVVRDLILGPKRFTDLRADLPGIGTNVLSTRLRELEHHGVIRRRELPPPAASSVYELSEYGRELEPILRARGKWGARTMGRPLPELALRSGWLGVAMRAFAHPEAAAGANATIELRLETAILDVRLDDGRVGVENGPAREADLILEIANEPLLALLSGAVVPEELVATGTLRVEGDESLLDRFLAVFPFPAAIPDEESAAALPDP